MRVKTGKVQNNAGKVGEGEGVSALNMCAPTNNFPEVAGKNARTFARTRDRHGRRL